MNQTITIAHDVPAPVRAAPVPYKASVALEALILRLAPPHYATPDAPSTLDALQAAWANQDARGLPVFDGGCDHTIYSSPDVNYAFRAWHDSIHVQGGYGFDGRGEECAMWRQCAQLLEAGLPTSDWFALYFDVWGQFLYSNAHGGEFPADQAAFVGACFAYGMRAAVHQTY